MTTLISVGQMPAVTAAVHRTHVPVRPLQAKAAATYSLSSAAPLAGRGVVLESRCAPLRGGRAELLQYHQPSLSAWGVARAGLQTPARYEPAPASATWPAAARASQHGAASGQPGLRPGGENATDGVTGSQAWTLGGGR